MNRHLKLVIIFGIVGSLNQDALAQNLVSNPSFEDTVKCPNYVSQISNCKGWMDFGNSPDFFHACGSPNMVGVPDNIVGSQIAATGFAYGGVITHSGVKDYHEVFGRKLDTSLTIGKRYFVSFKTSLSDKSKYASNNLGAAFTVDSFGSKFYFAKNESKVFTSDVILNYTSWQVVAGSFIADSNYNYIRLGNFSGDSITTLISSQSPSALHENPYYYIDDVCLSEDSTCFYNTDLNEPSWSNDFNVYPNPFNNLISIISNDTNLAEIVVYDQIGGIYIKKEFSGSVEINTEDLPAGLYYYQIRNDIAEIKKGILIKVNPVE